MIEIFRKILEKKEERKEIFRIPPNGRGIRAVRDE
jgi:hypothetical protein